MNNQQQKTSQLAREYYQRTQSERILDRHLLKRDKIQQLHELEKELYGNIQKKVKQEDQPQNEILPHEALSQVMKYLNVEQKAFKVVDKIRTLFQNYQSSFHPEHIIETLYELSLCKVNFKRDEIRKKSLDIYSQLDHIKDVVFPKVLIPIFELLGTELYVHNKLFTDDQFQFNMQVKELNKLIEQIEKEQQNSGDSFEYKEPMKIDAKIAIERAQNRQAIKSKDEQLEGIRAKLQAKKQIAPQTTQRQQDVPIKIPEYDFEFSENMKQLLLSWENRLNLKQELFLQTVADLIKFYRQSWARASVNQFMYNLFHNHKFIFKPEQQQRLEDLMTEMQNLKTSFQSQQSQKEADSVKEMKDYLKPTHQVTDSRSTVIVTDNVNKWASKQCGL